MSIEDEKKEERQRSIVREEQIIGITSQVTNPMMIEMLFEGKLQELPYYKIPLNHLIYNKYNGRILSRTKSIESLGKKIRPDTLEGKKTISKLSESQLNLASDSARSCLAEMIHDDLTQGFYIFRINELVAREQKNEGKPNRSSER